MSEKWSNWEVFNKTDSEGGIFSVIDWGLKSDMIEDENLASLWWRVETAYNDMQPYLGEIGAILNSAEEPEEEDETGGFGYGLDGNS